MIQKPNRACMAGGPDFTFTPLSGTHQPMHTQGLIAKYVALKKEKSSIQKEYEVCSQPVGTPKTLRLSPACYTRRHMCLTCVHPSPLSVPLPAAPERPGPYSC